MIPYKIGEERRPLLDIRTSPSLAEKRQTMIESTKILYTSFDWQNQM